ncbi:hypothetical protein CARUB_v10027597mg [Capsella rubella]|uniref:Prolamin-like domain-containing protein n=1 Tax=Capsella rubella TaxID=81985 RepID=R0GK18_9BRAS|nr:hypothetical protein CARUB_v10027597mg [Capsella rubella]
MSKVTTQITTLFIVVALVCSFVPVYSIEEVEAKLLWDTCLVKITLKCALNIISVVFGNGTIFYPCCNDLIKEGKVCHDTLTKYTLIKYIADRPNLIAHETEYLKKRDEVWTLCLDH